MRINYLEEQLLRLKQGRADHEDADLESEVALLRRVVEERDHKLAESDAVAEELAKQLHEAQAATAQAELAHREAEAELILRSLLEDTDSDDDENLKTGESARADLERQMIAQQERMHQMHALQTELANAKETADTLRAELQQSQQTCERKSRVSEQRKRHYQHTLQYMQRTNRSLLDELEHSRRMTKSQSESVLNLHEQVEAARQQKRKLEEEYVAKLRRFNEESQQQMELDQRAIRLRTVGWWRTGRVTRLDWLSKTTDFGKRLQV